MNSKTTASRKSISTLPVLVGALFLGFLTVGSTSARAAPTPLMLINGWSTDTQPQPTTHPAVVIFNGLVHFKGAMIQKQGNSPEPFVLPPGFRPATVVYVPVLLFAGHKGRLIIHPSGEVDIDAEGGFSEAQNFTSLDGVSFAPSAAGFTPLTLINGWTNAPFNTSNAAVKSINGVVHFKGAIATAGTNTEPFVLPPGFRPAAVAYVAIDLCNAAKGRLIIEPSGVVNVQAQNTFSSAQCFTSLDGASFVAAGATGYKDLKLLHKWQGGPFGTGTPAANTVNGHFPVYLKGALAGGNNAEMFVLPAADGPGGSVYLYVDLCDVKLGQFIISSNGEVQDGGAAAKCFTSLDGVSFLQ